MIFHENRLLADDSHETILMKYHTLFLWKIRKDVTKFVVCCSRDWRFGLSFYEPLGKVAIKVAYGDWLSSIRLCSASVLALGLITE